MMSKLKQLLRGEVSLSDVLSFFEGEIRYKFYYSRFKWLLRSHILEQIEYRLKVTNPECMGRGSCIHCGCEIPALQMASKSCEGNCYPPMISKYEWDNKVLVTDKVSNKWIYSAHIGKYILYKETETSYVRVNQ